jgi:hypothetical protein
MADEKKLYYEINNLFINLPVENPVLALRCSRGPVWRGRLGSVPVKQGFPHAIAQGCTSHFRWKHTFPDISNLHPQSGPAVGSDYLFFHFGIA